MFQVGGEEDRSFREYVREDLLLSVAETALVPLAARLRHTLALFEWFSCQRSVRYIALDQDPFKNVIKMGK